MGAVSKEGSNNLYHCMKLDLRTFDFGKRAIRFCKCPIIKFLNLNTERDVYYISPLQFLSKTFTCSSNITLPNIRKSLVKVMEIHFFQTVKYLKGLFLHSVYASVYVPKAIK